jgi:hypothetical protein
MGRLFGPGFRAAGRTDQSKPETYPVTKGVRFYPWLEEGKRTGNSGENTGKKEDG